MSLTKGGKQARAIAIAFLLYALFLISANLWWVGIGNANAEFIGWCWGSMSQCVVL